MEGFPYNSRADGELELLAAGGDEQAFGALYERHADAVHDYVTRIVRVEAEAWDLTHDAFVKAFTALNADRAGDASFRSWLFTIARNLCINRLERLNKTQSLESQTDRDLPAFYAVDATRANDPELVAQVEEAAALVWEAADGLPERERSVLQLHVRHGLASSEIAAVLGVSTGNAYTIVSRARDAFEASFGALVLSKSGGLHCSTLGEVLGDAPAYTPELRRAIDLHTRSCEPCTAEKERRISPLAVLPVLALIAVPFALRQRGAEAAWQQIQDLKRQAALATDRLGRSGAGGSDGGGTHDGLADGGRGRRRAVRLIVAALAGVIGVFAVCVATSGDEPESTVLGATASPSATREQPQPSPTASPVPPSATATTPPPRTPTVPIVVDPPPPPATSTIGVPPPPPTATPSPPPTVTPVTGLAVAPSNPACEGFWDRQPATGAGFNNEYAEILIALQNDERAHYGYGPLIRSGTLDAVASAYARFFLENQWWTAADPHRGTDGLNWLGRLRAAGALGQYGEQHSFGPPGQAWRFAAENWTTNFGHTPCYMHNLWTTTHINNFLGITRPPGAEGAVLFRNVYIGVGCYADYAAKKLACIQNLVFFD